VTRSDWRQVRTALCRESPVSCAGLIYSATRWKNSACVAAPDRKKKHDDPCKPDQSPLPRSGTPINAQRSEPTAQAVAGRQMSMNQEFRWMSRASTAVRGLRGSALRRRGVRLAVTWLVPHESVPATTGWMPLDELAARVAWRVIHRISRTRDQADQARP